MAKKILAVISATHASAYYRLIQPLKVLEYLGHKVNYTFLDNGTGAGIDWDIIEQDYDIAIFQFGFHKRVLSLIKRFKSQGTFTILETDDDYYHIPSTNKSFWQLHPRVISYIVTREGKPAQEVYVEHNYHVNFAIDNFKKSASEVDLLQVSTQELANYYSSLNNNIVVLENCVNNQLYNCIEKEKHNGVVMGWFGVPTHAVDLRYTVGAIPDNITFLTHGHTELNNTVYGGMKNIISTGYFDLMELPKLLSEMDFGIVPLEDSLFNAGKSDLKGLEFAAMSLPVIASPVAPYRRFIRNMENGILLKNNNGKHWLKAINLLANDSELRERLGREAKKDAIKRDIINNIDKWIKAYRLE